MRPNRFIALASEKLERRELAAADLVFGLSSAQNSQVNVGMSCSPYVSAASGEVTLQTPVATIYEQADKGSSLDVDQDGYITPEDANLVISQLTSPSLQGPMLPESESNGEVQEQNSRNYDVNGDGVVSPTDALMILNRVHSYTSLVPCTCSNCMATIAVDGISD